MNETSIEWTDCRWNPTRGCTRVSEGCRNCYAERQAVRFARAGVEGNVITGRGNGPFYGFVKSTPAGPRWTGRVELVPSKLDEPLRWRKPQRVFVNSMSDLFHEALPDEAIDRVFAVMAQSPQHTFQILTKRPRRMRDYLIGGEARMDAIDAAAEGFGWCHANLDGRWPLPNVWLGVSVEDQRTADERIPLLLQTLAAVRFVSYEPALGPVDLRPYVALLDVLCCPRCGFRANRPRPCPNDGSALGPDVRVNWVIVGGESGPGARPMHPDWPRSVRDQCREAGVAFFFKQRGAWCPRSWGGSATGSRRWGTLTAAGEWWPEATPWNGRRLDDSPTREEVMVHVGGHGGDPAEWPEDLRVREFPEPRG